MKFDSTNPDAQNCQVVKALNDILRGIGLSHDPYAKDNTQQITYERLSRHRDAVLRLQGTPLSNTGLAFQAAVSILSNRI